MVKQVSQRVSQGSQTCNSVHKTNMNPY
jgi:hypothetical protein